MTRRAPSRDRDTRHRWPVFMMCLLALAASVHFYALYAAKSAAAGKALEASRQAHVTLAGIEHRILVAESKQKSVRARLTKDQLRFLEESNGISGPGFSGMAGMGPRAHAELMIRDQNSQVLQTVMRYIQGTQRAVATIERALAAADSAARFPQVALAWSLVALIISGLLTAVIGAMNAHRFIVRQGDHLLWTSLDWRRIYAADGWTQVLTVMLVGSALSTLGHADDRDRYGEEWAGDMADISGKWRRAWWAITLRIFAPHGINGAREELTARKY